VVLAVGEDEWVWLRYTERRGFREVVTDILDVAILTADQVYHLTFYADPTQYVDYETAFNTIVTSFSMTSAAVER
jgi:hypothetical protein